ncbi:quinone oxidoreductase family protein [Subtercola lobariae]|uniref:Alcohol dehydrogenase n=1 Tax=Subtercola lobariae TaxID=1588641 RepID=A0A917BCJ2_9MICO|nr:quinone oxidoreductase [Subtercola lobariae]GGF35141.1 alcohol dehydrogenase [Subtercola lobariae]
MRAVSIHETGAPDVLRLRDVEDPQVGESDVLVAVTYAGVNFLDIQQRRGLYPVPLPFVPGVEGTGVVVEVGSKADPTLLGARVSWFTGRASYAERVVLPANHVIRVPDGVDDTLAAAILGQGVTAYYLTSAVYPVTASTVALVHAAAGGTGRLITQMIKHAGGTVLAVASTPAKCEIARAAGADHVFVADAVRDPDLSQLARQVMDISGGVDVVFDGTGTPTLNASIRSVKQRGTYVLYGTSGGGIDSIPLAPLRERSLFFTFPRVNDHVREPHEIEYRAQACFDLLAGGHLDILVDAPYDLSDAAAAHRAIEARQTTGKVLLMP